MPLYKNTKKNKYVGFDNLAIHPDSTEYSIYYYNIPELIDSDTKPYYNPIKMQEYIDHQGGDATIFIEFDQNLINKDCFINIVTNKIENNKLNDIELYLNSLDNTPPIFLTSGVLSLNNINRIKSVYIVIKSVKCEILVNVSDKFLIGGTGLIHTNGVIDWGDNL